MTTQTRKDEDTQLMRHFNICAIGLKSIYDAADAGSNHARNLLRDLAEQVLRTTCEIPAKGETKPSTRKRHAKAMKLLNGETGLMECKHCGSRHTANLGSGGRWKRGSWQCGNPKCPSQVEEFL